MTMTSPLRGAKSPEGGGFAAAHLLARRAGYGAAPPASRVLRIALARDSPAGCPGPRRPLRPLGPGRAGRPRPALPRCARRANPRRWRATEQAERQDTGELAFDSQKKRENYKPRVVSRIK
jgi:hypothetical protein